MRSESVGPFVQEDDKGAGYVAHGLAGPASPAVSLTVCHLPINYVHMKPIQIMMDRELLEDLDDMEEVKRDGRSAVLRRAATEYVLRRRNELIRERYQRAYGDREGICGEYEGWEDQGAWPED